MNNCIGLKNVWQNFQLLKFPIHQISTLIMVTLILSISSRQLISFTPIATVKMFIIPKLFSINFDGLLLVITTIGLKELMTRTTTVHFLKISANWQFLWPNVLDIELNQKQPLSISITLVRIQTVEFKVKPNIFTLSCIYFVLLNCVNTSLKDRLHIMWSFGWCRIWYGSTYYLDQVNFNILLNILLNNQLGLLNTPKQKLCITLSIKQTNRIFLHSIQIISPKSNIFQKVLNEI